jgi:hypothetical protein
MTFKSMLANPKIAFDGKPEEVARPLMAKNARYTYELPSMMNNRGFSWADDMLVEYSPGGDKIQPDNWEARAKNYLTAEERILYKLPSCMAKQQRVNPPA